MMPLEINPALVHFIFNIDWVETFKFLGGIAGAYLFIHRIHTAHQARYYKAISDELVKINDMCIECFCDDTKLELLSHKIMMHLSFVGQQIEGFPYAGPLRNFVTFFVTRQKKKADSLFRQYEDSIMKDTPIENKTAKLDDIDLTIDKITNSALELTMFLDNQLRYIY